MAKRGSADLMTNMSFRLSWIDIAEYFLRLRPTEEIASFLQAMLAVDRDAVALLAGVLRQEGAPPSSVKINDDLVEQARVRRTEDLRMRFIQQGLESSLNWYRDRLNDTDDPHRPVWQQLFDRQKSLMDAYSDLLSQAAAV